MENINFSLSEIVDKNNQIVDLEQEQRALHVDYFMTEYTIPAYNYIMYYDKSFSAKELTKILQYYGIQKGKMVKDEMLQILLLFETEPANKIIVERRMRLWNNIQELKSDPYFSKYILF